ncbi:UDP-N-acetylmuramoyl-L-alanine--D-glutamate ligase [Rhizobium sp. EC-SD404]|uniref:UDP-N-acetylmuramoyl-L-alanine--D-glutamate ligase n=1 Tax=Rhizobium sp. EC-SD404 TaxID=2038389 RepID=UPI00125C001D|nr:UDP-N-acetylmuramoyl-L-alanine--D-glutamate ligase [Rhizobium sp. EC-SD404]VVT26359.1 UDP-N-acetylmuramoylalanine--D-glutamate ligase [Rhizobium sp. EC-SD404]
MIAATTFNDQKVALFGLGGSGIVTARALVAGGANLVAWDDNPESVQRARDEGIITGDLREIDWSEIAYFVLSPGVPLTHPKPHWSVDLARQAGVEIIGDIEIFCRERRATQPDAPFIAITGTNGKSTTTALIAHILGAAGRDTQLGGNIGTAVLSLDPPAADRFFVVECSSYQIDLAPSLDPTAGILLNLSPDHLDRHGGMDNYAAIKERLLAGSDVAIVGVDDDFSTAIADRIGTSGSKLVRISKERALADGLFAQSSRIVQAGSAGERTVVDLAGHPTLKGAHNAQNAAAAIAACLAVGLTEAEIEAGIRTFPGLKHRMQPVGRRGAVVFVNDSKATNADAAAPALSSFTDIHWILGGLPKAGGITSLQPFFSRISKAYLIGEAAPDFAATLGEAVPYEISGTLDLAVLHAARDAAENSAGAPVVLLSPACASFDQYRNFEVRGDAFVAAVAGLDGVEMLVPFAKESD